MKYNHNHKHKHKKQESLIHQGVLANNALGKALCYDFHTQHKSYTNTLFIRLSHLLTSPLNHNTQQSGV